MYLENCKYHRNVFFLIISLIYVFLNNDNFPSSTVHAVRVVHVWLLLLTFTLCSQAKMVRRCVWKKNMSTGRRTTTEKDSYW